MESISNLKMAGINVCVCLLLGGPGENRGTLEETFSFLDRLKPTTTVAFGGVRIYPRTRLAAIAEREGYDLSDPLTPLFYFSREVGTSLSDIIRAYKNDNPGFIFEGIPEEIPVQVLKRLKKMNLEGPVWEIFSMLKK
jgi:hypothetical protein